MASVISSPEELFPIILVTFILCCTYGLVREKKRHNILSKKKNKVNVTLKPGLLIIPKLKICPVRFPQPSCTVQPVLQ